MNKLALFKTGVTKLLGRTSLVASKHSPEILMVVGIVGIVSGTVLACKATLKVDALLAEQKEKVNKIKDMKDNILEYQKEDSEIEYTEKDYQKDLTITTIQTGVAFIKLYGPAILLTTAGIACVLGSHGILKKRNLALMAAYKTIEKAFDDYRSRVVEEFGKEKDYNFKHGIRSEEVETTIVDEKGKTKKVKTTVNTMDPTKHSMYAKIFDEYNINWEKNPEYTRMFLQCQQNYANDKLHARGHLFLNEVYDMLGFKHTETGALVGWIISKDFPLGDTFVDFGLFDLGNVRTHDFINGMERSILLDFNVAGVIYDLI